LSGSFLLLSLVLLPGVKSADPDNWVKKLPGRARVLPDLSGLAWIAGDRFLAVHDAKFPEEKNLPRVSVLQLPSGLDGVRFKALHPSFKGPESDDLESIAKIPGTWKYLLVESTGDLDTKPFSNRIFLAEWMNERLTIIDRIEWPIGTENIEGTAVARIGDDFLFIFAERAHGEGHTEIQFARLSLDPLGLESFGSAGIFTSPWPTGPDARPVSAIDVDSDGMIYAASAGDTGDDNGPFRSAIYKIGAVESRNGQPEIVLDAEPETIALLDGVKVESIAVCEQDPGNMEIFFGTDDENYGGFIRPVPLGD